MIHVKFLVLAERATPDRGPPSPHPIVNTTRVGEQGLVDLQSYLNHREMIYCSSTRSNKTKERNFSSGSPFEVIGSRGGVYDHDH